VSFFVFVAASQTSVPSPPHKTILKGRFVAQAESNAEDLGSGSFFGSSQHFVFEVESPNAQPALVKIFYVFREMKDRLPPSYLDYAVVRSLTVARDTLCDDSLEHMAYTQGFDANGHVVEHQFTLKKATGAPDIKITTDQLPCYKLKTEGLKQARRQAQEQGRSQLQQPQPPPKKDQEEQ
jgi:hypothetical protein